jgi:hypothetical protein
VHHPGGASQQSAEPPLLLSWITVHATTSLPTLCNYPTHQLLGTSLVSYKPYTTVYTKVFPQTMLIRHITQCLSTTTSPRPSENRRDPCLKAENFPHFAGPTIMHLGYTFDSRQLQITWPEEKHLTLHSLVTDMLQKHSHQKAVDIARVRGLVRHGAFVCPLGAFLSIRL